MAGIELGSLDTPTLRIIIPKKGDVNWAESIKQDCFIPISAHDHSGNGKGAKVHVSNLDGVDIPDIQNGEILKWDSTAKKFVASDLVVDITEGTPDTTKTAFQVYNQVTGNISLQSDIGTSSILASSTQLNNIKKIDTRTDALDIATGMYNVKRAGVYDLFARIRVTSIDTYSSVSLHFRKTNQYNLSETIYTKTVDFSNLEPIGTIKPFPANFNPNSLNETTWLECNGSSASSYPILSFILNQRNVNASSNTPNLNGTHGFLRGSSSNLGETVDDTTSINDIVIDTGGGTKTTATGGSTSKTTSSSGSHNHSYWDGWHSESNMGVDYWRGPGLGSMGGSDNDNYIAQAERLKTQDSTNIRNITGYNHAGWMSMEGAHTHTVDISHTHTVDTNHTHTLSGGDTETAPDHTKVKYWIKAAHASQAIELSILQDLDVNDKIFINATFTCRHLNLDTNLFTPKIDMTTNEGFLFKGFRLV